MSFGVYIFGEKHRVKTSFETMRKRNRVKAVKKKVLPTKKVHPVENNPLVSFMYPSSQDTRVLKNRFVRLLGANHKYVIGLEILPENKFQFKKFCKNKILGFEVLAFNLNSVK